MDELTRLHDLDRIEAPELWPEISSREPRPPEPRSRWSRAAVAGVAIAVAASGAAIAVRTFLPTRKHPPGGSTPLALKSNGKIAFLGGDQPGSVFGSSHIYVVNPDGSALRQLTSGDLRDLDPAWSPDGSQIAFVRTGGELPPDDIYVVNADGSGLRQLTHTNQFQNGPSWSPDGRRIVFARGGNSTDYDLFVMNADGSHVEQL